MKNETRKVQHFQPEMIDRFEVEELEERMEFASWSLSAKASNDGWEAGVNLNIPV